MKRLYTARDTMEAHFLKGLLEARDIDAVVQGEMLAAARGELPFTNDTLPSLWVREADLEKAHAVLLDYREGRRPGDARPAWRCPRCGEFIEPQFTHCWRCGTHMPDAIDPVPVEPLDLPLQLDYEPEPPDEPELFWHEHDDDPENEPIDDDERDR